MKKALLILALLPALLAAQDVALTVYNQNRALVRERRTLEIAGGTSEIAFTDVASQIDPTSVHFKSLTSPGKLVILEQNYEYDLVGAAKILDKYVDEKIRLVMEDGEVYEGVLLSGSRDIILRLDDGQIRIVRTDKVQHFDFPALPEGLITRPTLLWQVNNSGKARQKTELSYLTSGLSWHAEYVAVVDQSDENLELAGWVSIENRSGATYHDAKLKLVAGDVNLVQPRGGRMERKSAEIALYAAADEPQFEEKSFFEYHLYTLGRPATVKQNQTKQIALFPSAATPVTKRFIYQGQRQEDKVKVMLEFDNRKENGLGMPLPKGVLRVYKSDDDGALEFIGEDNIDHTPRNETLYITMGNAFDLTGQRQVMDQKKISARSTEETYKIVLKNHKDTDVVIRVVENQWQDWKIVQTSHEYDKKDQYTLHFDIPVKADGTATLTYTVHRQW